jgi:hypothetical protein
MIEPIMVISNDIKLKIAICSDVTSSREGNGMGAPTNTDMKGKYNMKDKAVILLGRSSSTWSANKV